jgi:hypothetical protein
MLPRSERHRCHQACCGGRPGGCRSDHPGRALGGEGRLLATASIEGLDLAQDISAVSVKSRRLNAAASAFLALLRGVRANKPQVASQPKEQPVGW